VLETIKRLALKLQALSSDTKPQSTLYNFAFGALYAFARAVELEFVDQFEREKNDDDVSKKRAAEVKLRATVLAEKGTLPIDGPWLAGHYYNSALLRVDICYEQAVRYFTQSQIRNVNEVLITALRLGLPPELIVPFWLEVRKQVNSLKHKSTIKTEGPAMPPDKLLIIIGRLIDTVEWMLAHPQAPQEPGSDRY
jgi:hypothetical protein